MRIRAFSPRRLAPAHCYRCLGAGTACASHSGRARCTASTSSGPASARRYPSRSGTLTRSIAATRHEESSDVCTTSMEQGHRWSVGDIRPQLHPSLVRMRVVAPNGRVPSGAIDLPRYASQPRPEARDQRRAGRGRSKAVLVTAWPNRHTGSGPLPKSRALPSSAGHVAFTCGLYRP